ncbi:MAG: thermonuclease family protein [Phycisphaerae bacterium]|nr:thermonuclease family protein [Phycisphaerae bacterium]
MPSTKQQIHKLTPQQRRRRKILRGVVALVVAVTIAGLLGFGDRMGLFGRWTTEQDLERYHDKTFLVVKSVDGDTIDIDIPDQKNNYRTTRIRLWGIDAPETVKPDHPVQHFGQEASSFTKTATLNKHVRVELLPHRTRGKYGRVLGYVYLPDGTMLNRQLIARGLAYAYPYNDHPHDAEFEKLQREARKNKIGLWKNVKDKDLPWYIKKLR